MVTAKCFTGPTPPWFDLGRFKTWLESKGISVATGSDDNKTDGGVHWILNNEYDLRANYWDCRVGWQKAIDWVNKNA